MNVTLKSTNARIDALEGKLDAILAAVAPEAKAKTTRKAPAKAEKSDEFVAWLRETAPQRAARKASNAEMAAWLRSKGLNPAGAVWDACKAGERNVRALKKLA